MAGDIEITVDTKALEEHLHALPNAVSKRYLKTALQVGGDVVLASMKELAPERTDEQTPDEDSLPPGILKQDLQTQITVTENGGARIKIGPTAVSAHVCRWQENGWMLTSHKPNHKKIKQIPGKHFMSAAVDESGQAAIDAFVNSLATSLNTNDSEDTGETL